MKTTKFHLLCLVAFLSPGRVAQAAVYLWNSTNGVSPDAFWSDSTNWLPAGIPGPADTALFNRIDAVSSPGLSSVGGGPSAVNNASFNSVVDTNFGGAIATLICSNTAADYQNIYITNGMTLYVTNQMVFGSTNQDFGSGATELITIAGPQGALVSTNNTNADAIFGLETVGGTGAVGTVDMSGLGFFTNTCNRFLVGTTIGTISGTRRPGGVLYLAQTNAITAGYQTTSELTSDSAIPGALLVGDTTGNNGGDCYLYLGQANTISADSVLCARQKVSHGQIEFNPNLTGNPSATFGGYTSPRVSVWSLSDGVANSGTTSTSGVEDFSLGTINAMVDSMYIGRGSSSTSGSGVSTGTLTFGAGTINVNTLYVGLQTATNAGKYGVGAINVNSNSTLGAAATLVVNSNLLLGQAINAAGTSGTLSINGGNVWASTVVGSVNGGGSVVNVTQGVLGVTNTMGTASAPITTLSLTSATLQLAAGSSLANAVVSNLLVNDSTTVINVSSLPQVFGYPTSFPLVAYTTASGTPNLGTLPGTFSGNLSNDNSGTIWVVVTNGPVTVKTDEWGGNANNIWDTTSLDWTNNGASVAYGENDIVIFDDLGKTGDVTVPAAHTPSLWTVSNNILNYVFSGSGSIGGITDLEKDGSASLTLAESGGDAFSGGIDVTGGTLVLDEANAAISGGLRIASGATAQIGNGDLHGGLPAGAVTDNGSLIFDSTANITAEVSINGLGTVAQNGSGKLTLAQANGYTGNTTVSAGTLALTAPNALSNSTTVSITTATLDASAVSGTTYFNNLTLSNAAVTINVGYLQPGISVNTLNVGSSSNVVNVLSLPPIASYPTRVTLIQSAAAFVGFNFTLGTIPAGYAGTLVQSADGTAVQFRVTNGPIGTRPVVYWSGVDASVSSNWSDALNWQLPGEPVPGDIVVFDNSAAQSSSALSTPGGGPAALQPAYVNNAVNSNFSVSSLTYTNIDGNYHNTFIAANATLSITNILSVGSSSTDFGSSASEYVTIAGSNGTLTVDNPNGSVFVGCVASAAGIPQATLDMSALGNFEATVSTFGIGALASTSYYLSATAYLAQSNVITASGGSPNEGGQDESLSFAVGETGKGATGTTYLYLGRSNSINANSIGVAIAKEPAQMAFNPALSGQNPGAVFRAADGVSPVSVWSIGDALGQSGSSTAPTGTVDFSEGTVDALVATLYVGRSPNVSGGHAATGFLTFGAGTINVGTMYVGDQAYSQSDYGVGNVTLNGPGSLIVSNLNLALTTGGSGAASTAGTLTVNGGAVWANTIVAGSGGSTSTINVNGATVIVTNTAGSPAAPLTSLSLTSNTLGLAVNGSPLTTNVVATGISASGVTLRIQSFSSVGVGTNYPLISYTGSDPFSGFTLAALPSGYTGSLVDDTTNSLISLKLTSVPGVTPPSPPVFTGIKLQSGTNLVVSGTNASASGSYYVLTSSNLALALPQWTRVATNAFSNGEFSFTNTILPGAPQQFYVLQVR